MHKFIFKDSEGNVQCEVAITDGAAHPDTGCGCKPVGSFSPGDNYRFPDGVVRQIAEIEEM